MKIFNEIKNRCITLTVLESEKEHFPSHRIQVNIVTENIQAGFDRFIWLSETDIERFIQALELLEYERKIPAVLNSMSPDIFQLSFIPIDAMGHLSVELVMNDVENTIGQDYAYRIGIAFEIDPTLLPYVINDLRKLISSPG